MSLARPPVCLRSLAGVASSPVCPCPEASAASVPEVSPRRQYTSGRSPVIVREYELSAPATVAVTSLTGPVPNPLTARTRKRYSPALSPVKVAAGLAVERASRNVSPCHASTR